MSGVSDEEMTAISEYCDAAAAFMRMAAIGNRDAQAEIAQKAFALAMIQGGGENLIVAQQWARLAAAHELRADVFFLVGVLTVCAAEAGRRGIPGVAAAYRNECLLWLQPYASAGDDEAAAHVDVLISDEPEKVLIAVPENQRATAYLACVEMQGTA